MKKKPSDKSKEDPGKSEKKILIVPPGLKERYETFKDHYEVADGAPILILGPTGVGKTLFYEIYKSLFLEENLKKKEKDPKHENGPVVMVNCAHFGNQNSDSNIARSELFGTDKNCNLDINIENGLIQQAHGGVLFLEEIGELPIAVQAMLLTFIEDKKFKRLGGSKEETSVCRIVAATNNEGTLREDFKNRFFPFNLPPIHKRRNDVLYYLHGLHEKYPNLLASLTKDEILELLSYNWPGNVREIERVALLILRIQKKRERDKWLYYKDVLYEDSLWKISKTDEIDFGGSDRHKYIGLDYELEKKGADVQYLESLINKYGLSLILTIDDGLDEADDFPFGSIKTSPEYEIEEVIGEYIIKICTKYEPFEKAYEGFTLFCRLFLQDPLDNKNVKKDLTGCCPKRIKPELNFGKTNQSKTNDLLKKIFFFLSGIELDASEKLPTNYDNLKLFLQQQAGIHPENEFLSSMLPYNHNGKKIPENIVEGIASLTQEELLTKYYKKILELTNGNVSAASRRTGIKRQTLVDKLDKYRIIMKK